MLHEALREVLGTHVEQKGSLVTPQVLRFDFSHFQKMTDEEIRLVEKIVNKKIRENIVLDEHRDMPIEEAKAMGAMALFSEKYGDKVRLVRFGSSVELCGGVHIHATGQIGMFKIVGESSIAAGIRRIEAITGQAMEDSVYDMYDSIKELKALFNNVPNLQHAIRKSIEENGDLKKQIDDYVKEKALELKHRLLDKAVVMNGIQVYKFKAEIDPNMVKDIAFQIRGEVHEKLFFVAGTVVDNKPSLTVMLSDDLVTDGLNASNLVREAAKLIQGGGGGQAHFATAGGKDAEGITAAIDKVLELANL